jgi:hypothetical protein
MPRKVCLTAPGVLFPVRFLEACRVGTAGRATRPRSASGARAYPAQCRRMCRLSPGPVTPLKPQKTEKRGQKMAKYTHNLRVPGRPNPPPLGRRVRAVGFGPGLGQGQGQGWVRVRVRVGLGLWLGCYGREMELRVCVRAPGASVRVVLRACGCSFVFFFRACVCPLETLTLSRP